MDKHRRKQWSAESMKAATDLVKSGGGLREAARLCNVPVETLQRRATGQVSEDCRPGPPTVLTDEEETKLADYLLQMSAMGFGLTREDVMAMAFSIAEKTGKRHLFTGGCAGRGWYDGFMRRHPRDTSSFVILSCQVI